MAHGATRVQKLPPQPTSFVGRTEEVADIINTLTDSACRLLTLVGPGGSGKTRLAIQVASDVLDTDTFPDGIYFVPLQSVTEIEFLISAIADALSVSLSGSEEAEVQLLNYLRDKKLLLVLDNVEQLLNTDSVDLLINVLNEAPAVTMLATSREVLQLQQEWLHPVHGLPVPEDEDDDEDTEAFDAVQLFIARARRVRPDFSPADERRDIVRICRLVEGMPLAIELAASWRRTLRCAVIADEIQSSIEFLETNLRNVPDRHRSMRAVFAQSWNLLSPEEQSVFMRLSVFRGGFRREAAEAVAGASLSILSTLVDKSLLRCEPNGRYQAHELLRQYAEEKLESSSAEAANAREAHCTCFVGFLRSCAEEAMSGRQLEAKAKIAADLDNVRKAWRRAVDRGHAEAIDDAATALYLFYQYESRYREGADAFAHAVQRLDDGPDDTLAELLVRQALFCLRLGQLDEAETALERSRALHAGLDSPPGGYATDPAAVLGLLAAIRGEYDKVVRFGEEARRRSEAHGHTWNQSTAYYVLAQAARAKGQYNAAQQYARRAYALTDALDEYWFMAYCHIELGNVARAVGNYDDARHHYRASYDLRETFDDPEGMAVAMTHLGNVALLQDDYDEAGRRYERSLTIYEDISDRGGRAAALEGMGRVACKDGDYERARQLLHEALDIAADIRFVPLLLSILISAGELLLHTGRAQHGLELLDAARHHEAGDQEIKDRAGQLLTRHRSTRSEGVRIAADEAPADNLDTLVADLQAELAVPVGAEEQMGASAGSPALIEPLTKREQDVLELLAEGHTNREIAEELIIAVGTVKSHNHNIYGKLGVKNRAEAVARAIELELL